MKRKPTGRLAIYKSYNFVDKDPAIDVVRTLVQQSRKKYSQIQADGGPTPTCLRAWFDGKTRRPQFCTLAAATRAVGGDVVFIDPNGKHLKLGTKLATRRRAAPGLTRFLGS